MDNLGLCVRASFIALVIALSSVVRASESPMTSVRALTQKESVNAVSETVCLADVFEEFWVDSRCPRDKEGCCPWKLDTNRRVTVTRAEAARVALAAKVILDVSSVRGATETTVIQTHRSLGADEVRARVVEKLKALGGDGRWGVVDARTHGSVNVPLGSKWDVALPTTLMKLSSVKILYEDGSGDALAGWAQVTVAHYRSALVARRDIPAGGSLRPEDFKTQEMDVLAPAANADGPAASAAFDGTVPMRARLALRAGAVLTAATMEKAPAVLMGDAVTLVLKSENLKVMTKGISQGSGAIGDTVSVQLRSFNRTFRGKVAEGKQVEVWL